MKDFIGKDFLLRSGTAARLYYEYADGMPIFDFHNHLSPREIFEDLPYRSITQLWLSGDHYKWRAMRAAGVDERLITGGGDDFDTFCAWAETVERLPGSALYHWAHLELQRFFGIDMPLNRRNAQAIYNECNRLLALPEYRPSALLRRMNVKVLCTTDDPFDSLEWHEKIRNAKGGEKEFPFLVLPTFRPDKILHIQNAGWAEYTAKLADAAGTPVRDFASLTAALEAAFGRFLRNGCRAADHGFERFAYAAPHAGDDAAAESAIAKAIRGETPDTAEAEIFESMLLRFLGRMYAKAGAVMQLHLGAARNLNRDVFRKLGPDSGIDSVGLPTDPFRLGRFLSDLNDAGQLPKTILYCLKPADNPVLASLAASFCGGVPGKVQVGSAWWFNDNREGIRAHLAEIANAGLLSPFVGMLTDSRCILSFARHEYFRRILCDLLGVWVEDGEYPPDMELLGEIARDISFYNADRYFKGEQ